MQPAVYKKLTLRLDKTEYTHLKKQAELSGLKIEPMLRSLIMGIQLRPRPPEEDAALLRELSAIGNNINQLAYWANARKRVSEQELQEAIQLTKQAWTLLKDGL